MSFRTALFDLGNVLAFFSHDRMCEQMGALCGKTGPEVRDLILDSGVMWKFERGELTARQFHRHFESAVGADVDIEHLYRANADIFDVNEDCVALLEELAKRGCRIVLISNTSPWHVRWLGETSSIFECFDELCLSYVSKSLKPDVRIFKDALKRIRCEPHECLYVDDLPANVEAGRSFGLGAYQFCDTQSLRHHIGESLSDQ